MVNKAFYSQNSLGQSRGIKQQHNTTTIPTQSNTNQAKKQKQPRFFLFPPLLQPSPWAPPSALPWATFEHRQGFSAPRRPGGSGPRTARERTKGFWNEKDGWEMVGFAYMKWDEHWFRYIFKKSSILLVNEINFDGKAENGWRVVDKKVKQSQVVGVPC